MHKLDLSDQLLDDSGVSTRQASQIVTSRSLFFFREMTECATGGAYSQIVGVGVGAGG